ncbi:MULTISPECIES: hypothetical protein [unclassified Halomonas]|uniref:hypothetical protein n=1 Tax=unclassified Halomonas TaxID=2609666 RepID=UPI0007D9922C|nr:MULTISPECIES: hypothetical protein [unclassified Halomonas]MBT2788633.1 hypothetical protein [Halomonas sp. ISL-106]MBT2798224.1 hypothetical protein [Halomonas sp. ISL-104]OAL60773.1 hypothetical protein A6R74_18855 [Halomonas sp. ALS9]
MLDQIVRYMKGTWLKRILVVNHHHGVLIVVIGLEAQYAAHFLSILSILSIFQRQRFFYNLNA